jgi:hypothetical protein
MGRASGRAHHGGGGQAGSRRRAPWTDERIEQELRRFTTERSSWPTQREFEQAGLGHLAKAVSRRYGATHWARVLGLELRPSQDKEPFTEEDAVKQARAIIAQLGHLPGANKLRQLGYSRLATVVLHAGGGDAFCRMHGLPLRRR